MSHLKTLVSFVFVVHCVVLTTLANVISQQQQTNLSSSSSPPSSLPGLSERATGLNSRYLSASSTASLAAATVAAANQSPSSPSQQQPPTGSSSSNNNNNLPTNNNQIALAHQQAIQSSHHQAQQHQQQQQSQVNLQQSVGSNPPSGQPQQYTNIPVTPQQQLFAPQTPVMSTTYTYNPLVSQFQATDFAASNPNSQAQYFQSSQAQNPFGFPPNSYGILPGQLQQQTPFVQNRPVQRFHQQQHHRHPSTSFSRRNGLSRLPQQQQQQQQQQPFQLATIDDDSNGLFQQQQVLSNNNNYGSLNLDQFNLHESGGVNYVLNQHGQQQQQHEQQINPSHLQPGGVIFPSPSTTFGPAFGAANGQAPSSSSWSSSDQCVAADGRHGTCYQASECIKRGGVPMGKCGATSGGSQPGGSSNNFQVSTAPNAGQSDQFGGSSHVCCLFDITCGQFAAERFVYFRNPNYPATFDQSRMCRAKIGKLDKGVCQFRLDLLRFDVAKPTNGNCSSDMFVVSGQNENYVIPKICGFNDGQHYYVGVDESGVITLHMMMMGLSYRRSFEILITQIPCRSDYAAPAHCLQYFMGTHGTIKSFNYDNEDSTGAADLGLSNQLTNYDLQQDGSSLALASNAGGPPYGLSFNPNQQQQHLQQRQNLQAGLIGAGRNNANYNDQFGGYPNDLDYTICIRKESGFCSITYQLSRTELGLSPFGVGQFGLSNGDNAGWHQQQVSTECRDDYLLVGGVRLCSGSGGAGGPFSQLGQEGQQIYGLANQTTNPQQLLQLQNQQNLLMQQLTRLQQQQQGATNLNGTTNLAGQSNNGNPLGQQQTGNNINSANNLDQQQAAIVQQLLLIQQQMSVASGNNNRNYNQFDLSNSGHQQPFGGSNELNLAQNNNNLQGTIITDTTSGPFLLRFVSNMARNARGFHIDYRQNPCK